MHTIATAFDFPHVLFWLTVLVWFLPGSGAASNPACDKLRLLHPLVQVLKGRLRFESGLLRRDSGSLP